MSHLVIPARRGSRRLLASLAILAVPAFGAPAASAAPIPGDYQGVRLNGMPLPAKDRLPSAPGTVRDVSVVSVAASLRPDGNFSAVVRFTNETNRSGVRPSYSPTQDESVRGRYTVTGSTIRFVTERKGNGKEKKTREYLGSFANGQITMPFMYNASGASRRYVLELRKTRDW